MRENSIRSLGRGAAVATIVAWIALGEGALTAGPTNAILFVTQVPIPDEVNSNVVSNSFVAVASAFGNHLGGTKWAPRGGDLYIRYPDGTIRNLTRAAGYGVSGAQHTNGIAVRQPSVHKSGTKAAFSMVAGAPANANDTTTFYWQLYEITNFLDQAATPIITRVPNQPANYNNVSPTYGTDERIIFTSDRPRDGSPHLYPQRDEYLDLPTVTGLWSLDPVTGNLFLLNHTPSGVFNPFVDSFGRVIFTRWDHLVRDRNATDDGMGRSNNGTFNYSDESPAAQLLARNEFFPEPRTYDTNALAGLNVRGIAFNQFFPWQMTEDGTDEELINHVGRHELVQQVLNSFTNDVNLVTNTPAGRFNTNFLGSFFQIAEDPLHPGVYFGIDGPDIGTHASGQILTLTGPPTLNPDFMYITYITPKSTAQPNGAGLYRNPLPMSDGTLVAVHTVASTSDSNQGTPASPVSLYNFRLKTLQKSGAFWVPGASLTPGFTTTASYYVGNLLVAYSGPLWELDPVEVRPRTLAARIPSPPLAAIEQQVFVEEGVDLTTFQNFLRANNLALIISRNATTRDHADKQQPYNLKVSWSNTQTLGTNTGKIYDISYLQLLQADQVRGLTMGGSTPVPGRRVLPQTLHDPLADNPPNPAGPPGSIRLGNDGSMAALVPARRAMTWHLTDSNGVSVVKERYWLTFQPGEIRTCASCHGVNRTDQAGNPKPTNKPEALRTLLQYWKAQNTVAVGQTTDGPDSYLSLTFKRNPAATNVTKTVEISTDLINWLAGSSYSAAGDNPTTALTTEIARTGTTNQAIVVRDNQPITAAPQKFMRVKVSSP